MGLFKIFPAAAGIIALSATVSFARDLRDCEEGELCRTTIAEYASTGSAVDVSNENKPLSTSGNSERKNVYQVAITRGVKSWLVSIDAYSGKILDRRDL